MLGYRGLLCFEEYVKVVKSTNNPLKRQFFAMFWQIANLYFCSVGNVLLSGCNSNTSQSFQTDYFGIDVDSCGCFNKSFCE